MREKSEKSRIKKERVFIGYSNVAGNSTILVRVLRNLGYRAKFYYFSSHKFDYGEEKLGKKLYFSKNGKVNRFLYIIYAVYFILRNNVFIFSGQNTLLPSHIDLKLIKFLGKKIVFQFTGCDVRDYRWFINEYDYKYNCCRMCTDEFKKMVNCRIELKIEIVSLAEKYANLILAHPHYFHLFSRVPEFFWVPINTGIPENYSPEFNLDRSTPLRIIHAPSSIDVKGTKYIEEAINKLKSEGFKIDYERIQNMSNETVIKKIMECDLAIDQIFAFHGLFGVEAMNYSKPIICYVDKFFINMLPPKLPFIQANPENIYTVLKDTCENREVLAAQGKKSREYVLKHHDADNLIKNWIEKTLAN